MPIKTFDPDSITKAINFAVRYPTEMDIKIVSQLIKKGRMHPDDLTYDIKKAIIAKEHGNGLSRREFIRKFESISTDDLRGSLSNLLASRVILFDDEAKLYVNEPVASELGFQS